MSPQSCPFAAFGVRVTVSNAIRPCTGGSFTSELGRQGCDRVGEFVRNKVWCS